MSHSLGSHLIYPNRLCFGDISQSTDFHRKCLYNQWLNLLQKKTDKNKKPYQKTLLYFL